jgi:cytochrome o ubiquinol oxidase operon protein cyoD
MERDLVNASAAAPAGEGGARAARLKSYATGFALSLVLTAIPFALVMQGGASRGATLLAIAGAGVLQVMVHLYFFLHLDASPGARWNRLTLIFALLVMVLVVGGTVWIMHNIAYNMR